MHIDGDAVGRARKRWFNRRVGLAAGVVVAGAAGLMALPGRSGSVPVLGQAACCTGLRERQNTTPDISWLEVPRNLHACRHVDMGTCW